MPEHSWTCTACQEINPPYTEVCRSCQKPAVGSAVAKAPSPVSTSDDNSVTQRSFLPSKQGSTQLLLALGIGTWGLALVELISPRIAAPTGRWSWLIAPVFNTFGAFGLAILWVVLGAFLILVSMGKDAK